MSLIACGECSRQVSDKAASCPHCGAPIATAAKTEATVTTQLTSRKFKLQKLIAVATIIIGMLIAIVSETTGARGLGGALAAAGILVFIVARARAWWHSG